MNNETCAFCGDDLSEDQIEHGDEFCSWACERECLASEAEDRANEEARYGVSDIHDTHELSDWVRLGPSDY